MDSAEAPKKKKRKRSWYKKKEGPRKTPVIGQTAASAKFFQLFLKPFFRAFTFLESESVYKQGVEAFFGAKYRKVYWARAKEDFSIPGPMWRTQDQPHDYMHGTVRSWRNGEIGRRRVRKGNHVVVRTDTRTPDKNEIEFDEQVFVLTEGQWNHISQKLEKVL